jgi:YVTN family beta-propeller protein
VRDKIAIKRAQNSWLVVDSLYCDSGIIRFARSSIACCEQSGWHSRSDGKTIPHLHPLPLAKGEARTDGSFIGRFASKVACHVLRKVDRGSIEMYASRMNARFILCVFVAGAIVLRAEPSNYFVYVSNERSGDVTVIDGTSDTIVETFSVGKRPRGIHAAPEGKRVFVVTSGSPRMAPGVDTERPPADKTADGLAVIDASLHKLVDRWHVGSDPEEFAISKDGKFAFIANEDDASALIVDLASGQPRGRVKVSEEPEGVGVNPTNGEVYVTCEDKSEVFVISPDEQRVLAKIDTGGRPRSVAFLPDGSRAYVACENGGYVAVIDAKAHKMLSKIQLPTGSLPMGTAISRDGRELYVSTGRANAVAVVDTEKNAVTANIPVGNRAWGIALSPDGSKLYTANGASDDVSVVDVKARKELKRIKVGSGPWGIAIVPAAK